MRKLLLLLLLVSAKLVISQNGFTTYSTVLPAGTAPSSQNCIYVDNAGKVWIGYTSGPTGAVAIAVYNPTTTAWTFYNKTNTPALPVNSVRCFKEDNLGNMWIGTSLGLVKFDGANFYTYTTGNGLPANFINCLEWDNNMLYIGTIGGGLSRFDGSIFTNYNISNTLFPLGSIGSIKAESTNKLWMVYSNNLVEFSINSTFTSSSYSLSIATPTSNTFNDIYIDASGNKWLESIEGPTKFNTSGFSYFKNMFPDAPNGFINSGKIVKGPNNGALVCGTYDSQFPFLAEFLPNNKIEYYTPPSNLKPNRFFCSKGGKIFLTTAVSSTITSFIEFDKANYSSVKAFGQNPIGVTNNNYKYLDINRVKALVMNRGDMFWDIALSGNASYFVPTPQALPYGPSSEFASALWIGGLDASNQLHIAAQTYRQSGNDFWPGPLDTINGGADTLSAVNYDHIWKVSYTDINTFITQFNLGNVPISYTPTPDIVNWPAHGTGNKAKNLAPFVDVNGDGIYNWQQGDYPKIKGDQTLYFIFNDILGNHQESGGLPLGVEIHCMAYAYGCPNVINGRNELAYTTFYDYKIYNRSNNNYHDMYVSHWSDADLGNYVDDYISSSVHDNLGFIYNSDADDQNGSGAAGYELFPPACGRTILKGPLATSGDLIDNDNDSIIDEPGERCLLNVFDYYNNNIGSFPIATTNPSSPYHIHNYMRGYWKDNTSFTCGGTAYGGTTPTKFVYPWMNYQNNPCTTNWTELSAGNLPGDRRYIVSSGPFNLPSKGQTEFEVALVWSVDSAATSNMNIASANKLIQDARKVRSFYSGAIPNCLQKINIGIKENESINHLIGLYPNPAQSYLQISSDVELGKCAYSIMDVTGRTIKTGHLRDLSQSTININELNAGIYFLNLNFDSNQLAVKKFVKQ